MPGYSQSATTWPLEGFFTCGSGFLVVPDCLGQSFRTRAATYELTVTLPQLDAPDAGAPLRRPPWKFTREGEDPNAPYAVDADWGIVASTRKTDSGEPSPSAHRLRSALLPPRLKRGTARSSGRPRS